MIYESFPWKQDLYNWMQDIKEYNTADHFVQDEEVTYTVLEKAIFYTAFITRKLIDCKLKLSSAIDQYQIPLTKYKPLKEINYFNRWPEEKSYDWIHPIKEKVNGKDVCNWLIHSYVFFFGHDDNCGPMIGFYVSSDFDRNKALYYIDIDDWLQYIAFVATDDIVKSCSLYNEKKKDYVHMIKKRGSGH